MNYNPDALRYRIVWPFPSPTVTTRLWDNQDWLNYALAYRPKGYEGGEFDKEAFEAWNVEVMRKNIERDFPNFDIVYIDNQQFRFDKKVGG